MCLKYDIIIVVHTVYFNNITSWEVCNSKFILIRLYRKTLRIIYITPIKHILSIFQVIYTLNSISKTVVGPNSIYEIVIVSSIFYFFFNEKKID